VAAHAYTTLDGSTIRELVRPETHACRNLSVAEAVIEPGQRTLRHTHQSSEEVYYILQGEGLLTVNARTTEVGPGSVHLIRPTEEHSVLCTSQEPLRLLCLCAPPYRHEDTEITQEMVA
jgi:mannose-6-phosphate isomerase-like protein (cupin superfamily)